MVKKILNHKDRHTLMILRKNYIRQMFVDGYRLKEDSGIYLDEDNNELLAVELTFEVA